MTTAAPLSAVSFLHRLRPDRWPRELRLYLIHCFVYVVLLDLSGAYVTARFGSRTIKNGGDALIQHFRDDWWGYAYYAIILGSITVLLVHTNYWLFRRLTNKETVWGYASFGAWALLFFLVIMILVTSEEKYIFSTTAFKEDKRSRTAEILAIWMYAQLFVVVRAIRSNRRQRRELERQKNQAEIAALKAQVNPHFLFNTLNNLYGTALAGDSARTAAGIEQLSGVMRHIVEESKRDQTPIDKEIRFLHDTIDLHRMRLPDRDTIRVTSVVEWDEQPASIAPLLLVSFVENAFKYGISIDRPCFVEINLTVARGQLQFRCRNSIVGHNQLQHSTGTGIDNIRQRLQLIYPNRHLLRIDQPAEPTPDPVFDVRLTIDLTGALMG
jgi:sensor histidine kinase YesM